jgi:hypothetical protein
MVSSYHIFTTIAVPTEYIKLFNDYSKSYNSDTFDESVKTPSYFDVGYYPGGEETLNKWLYGKLSQPEESLNVYGNNWEADETSGILFDNSEKFHGSVRVLSYMIENFFKVHNIKLNGIIIGVNTEYPHLFFYEVVDNNILLNEALTRKYISDYEHMKDDENMCTDAKMMYNILSDMKKFYKF